MKDQVIKIPNDQRSIYHKGDNFKLTRSIIGIIKFVTFNKPLNETQFRVVTK